MKIQTIAEGIEEELQEAYLKKCRCMIGTGIPVWEAHGGRGV